MMVELGFLVHDTFTLVTRLKRGMACVLLEGRNFMAPDSVVDRSDGVVEVSYSFQTLDVPRKALIVVEQNEELYALVAKISRRDGSVEILFTPVKLTEEARLLFGSRFYGALAVEFVLREFDRPVIREVVD